LIAELRKTEGEWGRMERTGFGTASSRDDATAPVVANSTPEKQSENNADSQSKVRSA
jgi:hypothetical protein